MDFRHDVSCSPLHPRDLRVGPLRISSQISDKFSNYGDWLLGYYRDDHAIADGRPNPFSSGCGHGLAPQGKSRAEPVRYRTRPAEPPLALRLLHFQCLDRWNMAVFSKPPSTIHFAVSACVARCLMSEAQLTCLSDFTEELAKAGWDPDSIGEVERGVLTALYGAKAGACLERDRERD